MREQTTESRRVRDRARRNNPVCEPLAWDSPEPDRWWTVADLDDVEQYLNVDEQRRQDAE